MSAPLTLPQARIPLGWANVSGQRVPVEIDTEWMRSLIGLYERTGGVIAPSNDDLARDLPEDAGIEETKADIYRLRDEFNSQPVPVLAISAIDEDGRLQALEAQLVRLQQEIDAIKQGNSL